MMESKCLAMSHDCTGLRMTRIVSMIEVVDGQGTVAAYLRDVIARLGPMKMMRVTGKHDDAAGGVGLQRVGIEFLAAADVEDPGNYRVDSILFVHVRREFCACGQPHAHYVRSLYRPETVRRLPRPSCCLLSCVAARHPHDTRYVSRHRLHHGIGRGASW